jgi:hypothetical protein
MTKSRKLIILFVALAVVVAGGIIYGSHNGQKELDQHNKLQTASKVYTPTEVYRTLPRFTGTTLSLRGRLYHEPNGEYVISGTDTKPGGVKVDFTGTNINPDKYATQVKVINGQPSAEKVMSVVTLTGKVVNGGAPHTSKFSVTSVSIK